MEPAFVALGLLVGMLVGMTGVGAGSLVTPALTLSGVPAALAVGTDLAYAAASKTAGAVTHRLQHSLNLRLAGLLALGSVPAAGLTLAFLAGFAAAAAIAARAARRQGGDEAEDAPLARFVAPAAALLYGACAVSTLVVGLPLLVVPPCV